MKKVVILSLVMAVLTSPLSATTFPVNGVLITGTPYDRKLAQAGILDLRLDSLSFDHNASVEELFARARAFRYVKDRGADYWQTPQETAQKGSGDCEDKAVWLYAHLKQSGYDNVRLVIGKYKSVSAGYHVWVSYTDDNSGSYILDPATQKRIWRSDNFSQGFYKPLYSFDGQNRYRHPTS